MGDTTTIRTAEGDRQYQFAVIGNPCSKPDAIPKQAPDVNCQQGQLLKGTLSDHGYVIIGMLVEPGVAQHSDASVPSKQMSEAKSHCDERAASGNQGGMGMIFREVAAISRIPRKGAQIVAPATTTTRLKAPKKLEAPPLTNLGMQTAREPC